ncbi:MAG: Ig-like domain-containing protein [Planctomycetota bacterium]|nr:Ig-like domain-containing protein [Planctomycetota bacterium]
MRCLLICLLCSLMFSHALLYAADTPLGKADLQALPDELTLNVGDVEHVGKDVALILKKRSVRSESYLVGTWSKDEGFKKLDPFPVRTYRGYVKDKPVMRVNADIEPGGRLYANISVGRGIVASIEGLKINVPAGGKCTPLMSAGNKVVPVKATRVSPTPGGYLVPPQPMRRIEAIIQIDKGLVEDIGGDVETAVSQNEQRVNDADFVYARDIGVAWEINTIVIRRDDSDVDFNKIKNACSGRHGNLLVCAVGIHGKAHSWAGGTFKASGMAPLSAAGLHRAAGGLAHELGHKFRGIHNADEGGDCMGGGGDFIGSINGQLMIKYCEEGSEDVFPGVVYNGDLPPFLMDDVANTVKDKPVSIDVLANDFDGNGGVVSLQGVVPKSEKGGNVELSPDKKTVIYTPPPGFAGLDPKQAHGRRRAAG